MTYSTIDSQVNDMAAKKEKINWLDHNEAYTHIKHVHSKKFDEDMQEKYHTITKQVQDELAGKTKGLPAPTEREAHVKDFMKKYFGKLLNVDFENADETMISNLYDNAIAGALSDMLGQRVSDLRQAYNIIKNFDHDKFAEFLTKLPQAVRGEHLSKKREMTWNDFYTAHEEADIDKITAQEGLYKIWEKKDLTPSFKENYKGDLKADNIEGLINASLNYDQNLAQAGKKGRRGLGDYKGGYSQPGGGGHGSH